MRDKLRLAVFMPDNFDDSILLYEAIRLHGLRGHFGEIVIAQGDLRMAPISTAKRFGATLTRSLDPSNINGSIASFFDMALVLRRDCDEPHPIEKIMAIDDRPCFIFPLK